MVVPSVHLVLVCLTFLNILVAFIRCLAISKCFTMSPKKPISTSGVKKAKAKRINLTVKQKLELIRKLESGATVAQVCEEYGVKKQTVSDIRKQKESLEQFTVKYGGASASGSERRTMKPSKIMDLDAAVYKWYSQQRSCGVPVRGVDLATGAGKLAEQMGMTDFKASDGWLWRFRKRHGIRNLAVVGETESAEAWRVEPFRTKLMDHVRDQDLSMSQVYNLDETGILWRAMPRNTQASKEDKTAKGGKINKTRLSVLCGGNATGTHKLKLCITGHAKNPRALKDFMDRLPVHYYSSKKAWFTQWITNDYFQKHLIGEIRNHQENVLKIHPNEVKALVLLDNAPGHPSADTLCSSDGRIKTMFLPPNTTSLIQPMDQGVISAFKRRYQRKYLEEVLAIEETEEDIDEDHRGERTLENIKKYNIKDAIYNMAEAWNDMKATTLSNAWNKLLVKKDDDPEMFDFEGFEGFEAVDFARLLRDAGEKATEEDIREWIEDNDEVGGHEVLTEEEIVASVVGGEEGSDAEEEDDVRSTRSYKMKDVRNEADLLLDYVGFFKKRQDKRSL